MEMLIIAAVVLGGVSAALIAVAIVLILRKNNTDNNLSDSDKQELISAVRGEISTSQSALRQELTAQTQSSVKNMGDMLLEQQRENSRQQAEKLNQLEQRMGGLTMSNEQKLENIRNAMDKQLDSNRRTVEEKLENIRSTVDRQLDSNRETVEKKLEAMQNDNNRQLDEMRKTVDEKLQKTLEDKMNQSFSLVNERLEQVYKGLGEMQTLAVGVGDLKKVLSNVKTRGILGEIQLGSILAEILSPEQYEENIATKKGSKNVVEFAIKLPGDDDGFVYLPIDSKFPGDTYAALRDAIEEGDKLKTEAAAKALIATIKSEAKDIRDKYVDPPNTTEFAIMFLPFEGLYSEVVNRGLVETLQREYRVNVAGPSTMAALLNSLQMGFKTLAVQKRSAEVWNILGSVKAEFDKFGDVLEKTQARLDQANKELDKLVGVRTRAIQRKLKNVQSSENLIEDFSSEEE